jgi:4-diphosphocytidyl-2-C-methyl-D-erythritol kinase
MAVLVEAARAKINLTLRVLGRRADGYHDLESLVAFADVGDRLTLDTDAPDRFSISGPAATAVEGLNLVERVMAAVRAVAPELPLGHLHLEKHLPVAAGIGGGSADAAAALRLLERRWPDHPALEQVVSQAARFGADIPACLISRALVMSGIGERITPVVRLEPIPAVLVNPRLPLATASVFKALAASPVSADAAPLTWPDTLSSSDAIRLIGDRPNDLEAVSRRLLPAIDSVLGALAKLSGCKLARMSGSGSTCFGVFASRAYADAAAAQLASAHPGWWVQATSLS